MAKPRKDAFRLTGGMTMEQAVRKSMTAPKETVATMMDLGRLERRIAKAKSLGQIDCWCDCDKPEVFVRIDVPVLKPVGTVLTCVGVGEFLPDALRDLAERLEAARDSVTVVPRAQAHGCVPKKSDA